MLATHMAVSYRDDRTPQRPLIILVAAWLGLRTARILQRLHRVRRRRLPQLVLHFAEGVYRGLRNDVRGIQACPGQCVIFVHQSSEWSDPKRVTCCV